MSFSPQVQIPAAWRKSMFARVVSCIAIRTRFSVFSVIRAELSISFLVVVALFGSQAGAAEVRLLSAAAMQSVFKDIAGEFERTSEHTLKITYATMGAITQRVLNGETADLIIGSAPSISILVKEGKLRPDTQFTICKVGVGIVVPSGTRKPTITSTTELERALLGAKTVVYADPAGGGAAGIHVARIIEHLGITEQLKPKIRFGAGGDVTEVTLASGPGALGLTQISEIVNKAGAEFGGPLPEELQNYTVVAAGIPVGTITTEAVASLIAFLKSPRAVAAMQASGMQVD
jgi:molybdate transport system substrate-binding protein